ncbi:MAG: GNAT family N-acetyltransferase [Gammaproteobacteria bacterium]
MIVCSTPRLLIRQMTPGDAAFLHRQITEPSWIENIGDRDVGSPEEAARYIESRIFVQYKSLGYGMNLIQSKATGEPVGVCGLTKKAYLQHPDIGFALLERHWGQGYAVEAARAVMTHAEQSLGILSFSAVVIPTNERSAKVLGKLGFQLENAEFQTPDGKRLRLYAA